MNPNPGSPAPSPSPGGGVGLFFGRWGASGAWVWLRGSVARAELGSAGRVRWRGSCRGCVPDVGPRAGTNAREQGEHPRNAMPATAVRAPDCAEHWGTRAEAGGAGLQGRRTGCGPAGRHEHPRPGTNARDLEEHPRNATAVTVTRAQYAGCFRVRGPGSVARVLQGLRAGCGPAGRQPATSTREQGEHPRNAMPATAVRAPDCAGRHERPRTGGAPAQRHCRYRDQGSVRGLLSATRAEFGGAGPAGAAGRMWTSGPA